MQQHVDGIRGLKIIYARQENFMAAYIVLVRPIQEFEMEGVRRQIAVHLRATLSRHAQMAFGRAHILINGIWISSDLVGIGIYSSERCHL